MFEGYRCQTTSKHGRFQPTWQGPLWPKKTFASEEKWCHETQLRGGESGEGRESEVMAIHYPKGWWKVEWFLKLQNIQFDFLMKAENGIICIWNSSKTNFFLIRSKCFYTPPGRDRAEEPSSWIASLCHTKAEWLPGKSEKPSDSPVVHCFLEAFLNCSSRSKQWGIEPTHSVWIYIFNPPWNLSVFSFTPASLCRLIKHSSCLP